MESFRAWALSICMAALSCAAVQILAPKGGMGRLLHMILASFFLCALIQPVLSAADLLTLSHPTASVTDEVLMREEFNQILCEQTNEALNKRITALLESYRIQVEKVETDMNISTEGDIYMKRIIVYLDKQNIKQATTARAVLLKQLEIPVSIREA